MGDCVCENCGYKTSVVLRFCSNCAEETPHILVKDDWICTCCQSINISMVHSLSGSK